jgi:hypothetical protein
MAKYDVFLSYAHKDNHRRKRVQKALEERGLSVWVDKRGIQPGSLWQEAIQRGIDDSCCVVVILSPDALTSRHVAREINYAESQNKPIFPVLAGGNDKTAVPFALNDIQYVSIVKASKSEFESVMDALVAGIRGIGEGRC